MSRLLLILAVLVGFSVDANAQQKPRGAKRSPAHKLLATPMHKTAAVPPSFTVIPPKLQYWGNNTDGDCVSAEEAAAKAQYSVQCGQPETLISDADLIKWAGKHGWLNGAYLTEVMDAMINEGITTSDGKTYKDGPYSTVDWSDDTNLCSAIYAGPVKIGVAADQLSNVVGNKNGWFATGFRPDSNLDHCVNLCGYGTVADLAKALNVSVPSGVNPAARGYLLFTWSTIGIIDRPSLIAITGEAWLRSPTTVGVTPNPQPTPTPNPNPDPTPNPTPTPDPVPPTPPAPTPSKITVPIHGYVGRYPLSGTATVTTSGSQTAVDVHAHAGRFTVSASSGTSAAPTRREQRRAARHHHRSRF